MPAGGDRGLDREQLGHQPFHPAAVQPAAVSRTGGLAQQVGRPARPPPPSQVTHTNIASSM